MVYVDKLECLRIPTGLAFLLLFLYAATQPYRSRLGDSPYSGTPLTWKECFLVYVMGVSAFFAVLFIWENLAALVYPRPRRLSLTDDYINGNPPKVDKMQAFHYDTPLTYYERAKLSFFLLSGISFIRLFVCFTTIFLGMAFMCVAGWGRRPRNSLWFRFWSSMVLLCGQIGLAAMGFYCIRRYGSAAPRSECKLLVGNHSCVAEVMFVFLMADFPSFVSRRENANVILFSSVCEVADAIVVDRDAATSRKQTLDAIMERAKNPTAPQLMVFPEGTTGNQQTMFLFKKGAFEPGEPVQMVCTTFPYKHFNPAWTGRIVGGNDIRDIFLRFSAQFFNHAEIRFLPVYYPTEEEKADPVLYASHCQKMMATVLSQNISDATFKDYEEAQRLYEARMASDSATSHAKAG